MSGRIRKQELHSSVTNEIDKIDVLSDDFESHKDKIASETELGHIKIGDNLTIEDDGTLNAEGGIDYKISDRTPNETDDETKNFKVGSRWIYQDIDDDFLIEGAEYVCLNAKEEKAVWGKVAPGTNIDYFTFYDEGFENELVTGGWIEGASRGSGSVEKRDSNLYLSVSQNNQSTAERTFVVNNRVNLTDIHYLNIEWEAGGSHLGDMSFNVSENQDGNLNDYVVSYKSKNDTEGKEIESLDVSNLTGLYYIRVHVYDPTSSHSRNSNLTVYKIWGEKQ